MHQPPVLPPHRPSPAAKPFAIGCGVLFGLFALLVGCGALLDTTEINAANNSRTLTPSVVAAPSTSSHSPTVEPTASTSSPSPTPTVDAAAQKACVAHVQAVALRKAGWAGKADAQDLVAEAAVADSTVIRLTETYGDVAEALDSWCSRHLPSVQAKPVKAKPKPKPKPVQPHDDPDPHVPDAPSGASAICRDGTYSYSQNRRGTCSHHGGVAQWL